MTVSPAKPKLKVLVIGLGLIGASFAAALKNSGRYHLLGADRSVQTLNAALALGIVDEIVPDLTAPINVDVVVLAVPVMATEQVLKQLESVIPSLIALTDVGSVKTPVIEATKRALGDIPSCFVPGHPIAGAEKSGVEAANPQLFNQHMVIITPAPNANSEAVSVVESLWQNCGANVVQMTPKRHDEVLAATSHLPHLLAFSLVDTLAKESDNREIFEYAAGGFRDFSRIAASDATMWHDIFLTNSEPMLSVLNRFRGDLDQLAMAIEQKDSQQIIAVLERAKSARDHFGDILAKRKIAKKLP